MKTLAILIFSILPLSYLNAEEPKLKISFIIPLSGEWAFLGDGLKNGGLLAQNEINNPSLIINFDDNKGSLSESAIIANRLVANKEADIIVSMISGVAQVIKPIISKAELVQIAICSDSSLPDGKNNFTNYLTKEEAVNLYIEHFKKLYGNRASLGVYVQNEAGFIALANELNSKASELKLKINFTETFNGGDLDFRTLIFRSMKSKPTVLMLLGLSPSMEAIIKQIRFIDRNIPLSSIEAFGLIDDKSLPKGAWYVDAGGIDNEFENKYWKTYQKKITPGVYHAYTSVKLAYQAYVNFIKAKNQNIADNRKRFSNEINKININSKDTKNTEDAKKGVFLSGAIIRTIE